MKEVLQDVSHESKRRIKMVLENSEVSVVTFCVSLKVSSVNAIIFPLQVIGVTADLSLPMILLPKDSITERLLPSYVIFIHVIHSHGYVTLSSQPSLPSPFTLSSLLASVLEDFLSLISDILQSILQSIQLHQRKPAVATHSIV